MSWPTLHGDLQRSGFHPQFPKGPLRLVWRKELYRELTGPRAEVIVGDGLAFMGTYAGNLYAWDVNAGAEKWVFKTGGPIGHSPMFVGGIPRTRSRFERPDRSSRRESALISLPRRWSELTSAATRFVESSRRAEAQASAPSSGLQATDDSSLLPSAATVYFGSLDRKLYAVEAATGKTRWQFEAGEGIWVSPVVHRGRVMFGARDGVFYALEAANGKREWTFPTGDRILTSASISEDGGRVVFASEDMRVYCLEAPTGRLLWRSRKLAGLSVRDYAPVMARGRVLITTNPVKDFHTILGQHQEMLVNRAGFKGKDPRYIPGTPEDVRREQDFIVEFLKAHPEEQTFYAFNVTDGREPWIAPILYTGGLHNPLTPPCVNPQTGAVFTQLRSAYGTWDGGGEVRPFTGFGQLDLQTGRVALLGHGYPSKEPGRPPGAKDMPWMTFNYIGDETQTLSCAPDLLLCTHQGFIGSLNLKSGLTARLYGKRDTYGGFYGPGNFGWENQGGHEKARAAHQPFGIVNEWHGPARAVVSVAGNKVFFPVGSQVLCLEGQ